MSRTEAHDPYWVKEKRLGEVVHHHENGICDAHLEDTQSRYWGSFIRSNHKNCKKVISVEYVKCIHDRRKPDQVLRDGHWYYTDEVEDCNFYKQRGSKFYKSRWEDLLTINVNGHPDFYGVVFLTTHPYKRYHWHKVEERDNSIPCSCDNAPGKYFGNCYLSIYYDKHPPNILFSEPWKKHLKNADHHKRRQNERENLHELTALANSGYNLDDWDGEFLGDLAEDRWCWD